MFIVIEGPDGSGKTTLAMQLVRRLCQNGISAIYTCEPTYEGETGRHLRQLLKRENIIDPYILSNLFVKDRKEHIENLISSTLAKGGYIVCDRYKYSALIYQQLQGIEARYLIEINKDCLIPDIVFILLPQDINILLHRISERGKSQEIFEERDFLSSTLRLYRKLPLYFPDECIIFLEAEALIDENLEKILNYLGDRHR